MRRFLTCLSLAALLGGCAGAERPLTTKEFYGFCWPAQIDTNCWDDSLCDTYRQYLEQDHAGKEDCIKGCNDLQMQEGYQNALRGCEPAIRNATDWCITYCRRYYDYGPPATGKPADE